MRVNHLEDVIKQDPFRAFDLHVGGRIIPIKHPEQVFLTPDRTTLVVAHPDGRLSILDVDRIHSVTTKPRGRKQSA